MLSSFRLTNLRRFICNIFMVCCFCSSDHLFIVMIVFTEKEPFNCACFGSQVLGVLKWCSTNVFFLTATRIMFVGKFIKWVRLCCGSIFLECGVSWGFERNCIVKWVIFSVSFCWLWDFLLENLKLKDKLQIWGFESFIFWSKFRFLGVF